MPVPWLGIFDTMLGLANLVRGTGARRPSNESQDNDRLATTSGGGALGQLGQVGQLEARLAGVVVAALKEAFDRDNRRLELEREQMEAERRRAERVLRLELLRQAAEREVGRLRLIAGLSAASWLGTLFFFGRVAGAGMGARIVLAVGWALLLGALATSFAGQSRLAASAAHLTADDDATAPPSAGVMGAAAPWLFVLGLAVIAGSVLFGG
jgi:hypothetical protein